MPDLAATLEQVLASTTAPGARAAAERLRETYRSGAPPTALAIADATSAAAYAAYRMPATTAAIGRALAGLPFVPATHVDLGGGTGAAVWATHSLWPDLASTVLDASSSAIALGRELARRGGLSHTTFEQFRLGAAAELPAADLVTIGYLLGELSPSDATGVVDSALASARALLVVEPGTPRGYAAVLAARDRLRAAGWSLLAPCPHQLDCPLTGADWCHFSVRVQRSALHRDLKSAELNYEDEKFSFVLAVAPDEVGGPPAGDSAYERVLRHPLRRKGLVQFRVCRPDGSVGDRIVSRRQGELYRQARDTIWGDVLPATTGE